MKYLYLLLCLFIFACSSDNPVKPEEPEVLIYSLDSVYLVREDSNTIAPAFLIKLQYQNEKKNAKYKIDFDMIASDTVDYTAYITLVPNQYGEGITPYSKNTLNNYSFSLVTNSTSFPYYASLGLSFGLSLPFFKPGDFVKAKNIRIYKQYVN